jgi:hypothetical protein
LPESGCDCGFAFAALWPGCPKSRHTPHFPFPFLPLLLDVDDCESILSLLGVLFLPFFCGNGEIALISGYFSVFFSILLETFCLVADFGVYSFLLVWLRYGLREAFCSSFFTAIALLRLISFCRSGVSFAHSSSLMLITPAFSC